MIKKVVAIGAGILLLGVAIIVAVVLSYDFNRFKAPVAQAVEAATGRRLTLGGDIGLTLGWSPALVVEEVRLGNADWGSRPDMVHLRRLEVQVALLPLIRGTVAVERFVLIEPDILIETDAGGRSNLEFKSLQQSTEKPGSRQAEGPKKVSSAALPMGLALKDLEIRDGTVTYLDGAARISHQVRIHQVRTTSDGLNSSLTLSVSGVYNDADFTLDGTFGPLAAALDPAAVWPLKIEAKALDIQAVLEGSIKEPRKASGIDLQFAVTAAGLAKAAALAGQPLPLDGPLKVVGHIQDTAPKAYRVSGVELHLGPSDIRGDLSIDLSARRPNLKADLTSKFLDLAVLTTSPPAPPLPSSEKAKAKPAAAKPQSGRKTAKNRLFPDEALPLSFLDAVNANVSLRVERLALPKIVLEKLDAAVDLNAGRLKVAPLKAVLAKGAFEGDLVLASKAKAADLDARIEINALDLGEILTQIQAGDGIEGRVDAAADLKSRGGSVATLMAGMDGYARLVMEKGRVAKGFLKRVGGGGIVDGVLHLLDPAGAASDYTDINCAVVRMDVRRGVADATVLVVDTPQISVTGQGTVDLSSEGLDLAFKPAPKQALAAGRFGVLPMSLGELSQPARLGGTLAHPSLVVDPRQTILTIGKVLGASGSQAAPGGEAVADSSPCAAAIETAKTGRKPSPASSAVQRPEATAQTPSGADPPRQLETIIKGLFGN